MIQRIQSVYLLLVAAFMALTAYSPLLSLIDTSRSVLSVCSLGLYQLDRLVYPTWGVISIAILIGLLALVNLFLYKNRKMQVRLCTTTGLFILLFYATLFAYSTFYIHNTGIVFDSVQYGLFFPLVALLCNCLALGKIKKDEKLVRSLDRIR